MEETRHISAYRQSLREKILDKAMEAFVAHGIRAVKMDDIAQSLGISKRTLYEIYENKEVLLTEGLKKAKAEEERRLSAIVAESGSVMDVLLYVYRRRVEEFSLVNPAFYADMARYPQLIEYLEADKERHRQRMLDFLRRGVEEGYFRGDIDYVLTMKAFEAVSDLVMTQQLYRTYTMRDLFSNILFVMLRGICTKRGVDVIDQFKQYT